MAVPASAGCCICTTTQKQGAGPAIAGHTAVPAAAAGEGWSGSGVGARPAGGGGEWEGGGGRLWGLTVVGGGERGGGTGWESDVALSEPGGADMPYEPLGQWGERGRRCWAHHKIRARWLLRVKGLKGQRQGKGHPGSSRLNIYSYECFPRVKCVWGVGGGGGVGGERGAQGASWGNPGATAASQELSLTINCFS